MRWFSTEDPAPVPAPAPAPEAGPSRVLPPDHPPVPAGVDQCPVEDSARSVWLQAAEQANPMTAPPSPSAPAAAAGDPASLDTHRVISTIPRGAASTYTHDAASDSPSVPAPARAPPATGSVEGATSSGANREGEGNWVYPSEQQFFNAMLRKNHQPRAADMRTVVPIHNAVNEKAWESILLWEAGMGSENCGGPRLCSFVGRPKERTPKAWLKTLAGYTPPFDRHDWIVDRCGKQVRYVIDFYSGRPDPNHPGSMAFYLDVRPALDDWDSIRTRLNGMWR